jgi:hypothetical protein
VSITLGGRERRPGDAVEFDLGIDGEGAVWEDADDASGDETTTEDAPGEEGEDARLERRLDKLRAHADDHLRVMRDELGNIGLSSTALANTRQSLDELVALRRGRRTTDDLVDALVGPAASPPQRKRARDQVQQRHLNARKRLGVAVDAAEDAGRFSPRTAACCRAVIRDYLRG